MRHVVLAAIACVAVGFLGACNRPDDTDHAPPAAPSAAAGADSAPAQVDNADAITMRYNCGEHRIDVMGNHHARVSMGDGSTVELPYVTDSSPPLFAGEALEFAIDGDGAQLAQDGGASWPCSAE